MSSPHALCLSIVQARETALHEAAREGHLDMLRVLIQAGFDMNAVDEVSLFMLAHDILMHMLYRHTRSVSVRSSCSLFVHCACIYIWPKKIIISFWCHFSF